MNRRTVLQSLLGAAVLAALLLAVGLLLRPALAAPPIQEDAPLLTIVKTVEGDGTIGPGQTVRFHVTVTNTGEVTATNVMVQDDYDQKALPTISVATAAGASGAQNDGDVITWQLGNLPPGAGWSSSYEATAAVAFEAETTEVSNDASVYADGVKIAQTRVVLTVRAPQLTLTRLRERVDGEGEIVPGATVRYTIRYGNEGTADAINVILEEMYDETVVQQVDNVTDGGRQEGTTIRWSLGAVAAGSSGEVSYEVTLKPALAQGDDIEVRNQVTIQADGVERLSAIDSFTLRTPLLSIEREREDLSGGAIEPGDTLRFTIRIRNSGEAAALDVVVRDDFDERVVADISNISAGGREAEGAVEWALTEPLEPGADQSFFYNVRLISEIGQSTTAMNTASISIRDVELARAQTTMIIEPAPAEEAVTEQPQVFQEEPVTVSLLVGVSMVTALLVVGGLALLVLRQGQWKDRYLRIVIEGVAVIIIVEAVLILAMSKSIEPDGAVTILSGIAGYLLGRSLGESRGS